MFFVTLKKTRVFLGTNKEMWVCWQFEMATRNMQPKKEHAR